jgi:hypothetical protein
MKLIKKKVVLNYMKLLKTSNSYKDSVRLVPNLFGAIENENDILSLPNVVKITCLAKDSKKETSTPKLYFVHLRPSPIPPFLLGGGLKHKTFLGLKNGFQLQLRIFTATSF